MKTKIKIIILAALILLLLSCTYKFKIDVLPDNAVVKVNNEVFKDHIYKSNKNTINVECERYGYKFFNQKFKKLIPIGVKKVLIKMEPEVYTVQINTIEGSSAAVINDQKFDATPFEVKLPYGIYKMVLSRKDYNDQEYRLEIKSNDKLYFRHFKKGHLLKQVGIFKCGQQPKQVIFTPDDNYIFISLLDDLGFQVFDMKSYQMKEFVKIPKYGKNKGFPEGLFIPEKDSFILSQMTTGLMFEYSISDLKYKRTLKTYGEWSKFLAWSKKLNVLVVSNWLSNDVSIIDYDTGNLKTLIKTEPAPRGLAFSSDDKYLYITTYDGGTILKVDTSDWKIINKIYHKEYAAMRHIILTKDDKTAYVSNMHHNEIYEINLDEFKIVNSYKTDWNPNTISLSPDEKYIFASCRGPNDSVTYLNRSPRSGLLSVIDLTNKKTLYEFEGGNQPTGLAVSHDGNYLCFSNFLDHNFEIYYIGDLNK